MQFTIEATVTYTFEPNEETSELIREMAKERKYTLAQALLALYLEEGKVNPYDDSCGICAESDFSTEVIDFDGPDCENEEFWEY